MSFLGFEGKKYLVFGVANKKSVAWHIAKTIEEEGGTVIYVVRSEDRRKSLEKLLADRETYVCDVGHEEQIVRVRDEIAAKGHIFHGLVHSIAFANYSEGMKPFHETLKRDFLQSVDISCFSFISISNHFRNLLDTKASVVTVSISTTTMASENYGYMAPVKAALDSTLAFLAKSFSSFSEIRFNAVNPGLLKTSASAGIPNYIDSYLYAEKLTLRKRALETQEAANTAVFLLSERSSGITAQRIVLDAGMSVNYFDSDIVQRVMR